MIIYKVFDEEFEQIMGERQLSDFAISQVCNCYDECLEEYIEETFENSAEILELTKQIVENKLEVLTVEQAKTILYLRCFEVKEIEVTETTSEVTDIIEHNKETTLIKPSAMLKALTVYTQAVMFVQPVLKYKDTDKAFEELGKLLQHQNFFEHYNEDSDFIDFRWSNNNAKEGELDEIVITLSEHTYMPNISEIDTLKQFDYTKAEHYVSLSTWVMLGIKGEDYPIEYDIADIAYTVEKYYNLEDK